MNTKSRYEIRAILDAECTEYDTDQVLAHADTVDDALEAAALHSAGRQFGAAIVDRETGMVNWGDGNGKMERSRTLVYIGGGRVEDPNGGVWHPNEQTESEIMASDMPEDVALRICENEPQRGTWND